MMERSPQMDVLLATSRDAPAELVTPVAAALAAADVEVGSVDLGRVGQTGSRLGRVVQALLGEAEAGRLVRELAQHRPRVAVAFDPGAAAALVVARDRRVAETAVVAVVPDVAPSKAWAIDADRYAVLDDEAAVTLADLGVDGARVQVTGPIVPRALHEAGRLTRAEARAEYKLAADARVVLVDTRGLDLETLGQLTLQLSLVGRPIHVLFDAGTSAEIAAQLRRQVPTLGLKGKLFGDTPNAGRLWRCADVVIARPTPRAVHAALAIDAALLGLSPEGARQEADTRALLERGAGAGVPQVLFVGGALEPLLGRHRGGRAPLDGASETAELVRTVAAQHLEVLAESAEARAAARAAAERGDDAGAGDLEDLGDLDDLNDVGSVDPRAGAQRARLEREAAEARVEADKWEQRRAAAERRGERALAEQAGREADRKRARMHAALAELSRQGGPPPPVVEDDPLAAFKRKVGGAAAARTVEDELSALKARAEAEKKRR
jgi:hypothetical protein